MLDGLIFLVKLSIISARAPSRNPKVRETEREWHRETERESNKEKEKWLCKPQKNIQNWSRNNFKVAQFRATLKC